MPKFDLIRLGKRNVFQLFMNGTLIGIVDYMHVMKRWRVLVDGRCQLFTFWHELEDILKKQEW